MIDYFSIVILLVELAPLTNYNYLARSWVVIVASWILEICDQGSLSSVGIGTQIPDNPVYSSNF